MTEIAGNMGTLGSLTNTMPVGLYSNIAFDRLYLRVNNSPSSLTGRIDVC
jgi:hypothetical protein